MKGRCAISFIGRVRNGMPLISRSSRSFHGRRPPCWSWHRLEKSAAQPLATPLCGCASVVLGGGAGASSGSARSAVTAGTVIMADDP